MLQKSKYQWSLKHTQITIRATESWGIKGKNVLRYWVVNVLQRYQQLPLLAKLDQQYKTSVVSLSMLARKAAPIPRKCSQFPPVNFLPPFPLLHTAWWGAQQNRPAPPKPAARCQLLGEGPRSASEPRLQWLVECLDRSSGDDNDTKWWLLSFVRSVPLHFSVSVAPESWWGRSVVEHQDQERSCADRQRLYCCWDMMITLHVLFVSCSFHV